MGGISTIHGNGGGYFQREKPGFNSRYTEFTINTTTCLAAGGANPSVTVLNEGGGRFYNSGSPANITCRESGLVVAIGYINIVFVANAIGPIRIELVHNPSGDIIGSYFHQLATYDAARSSLVGSHLMFPDEYLFMNVFNDSDQDFDINGKILVYNLI